MSSEPEPGTAENGGSGASLAAKSQEVDFSLLLSRVIGSVKDDPAQVRNAVYELARFKLQREAGQRHPPLDTMEMRRLMQALERAIARVEAISAKHDALKALQSLDRLIGSSGLGASPMVMAPHAPLVVIDQATGATAEIDPATRAPARRVLLNLASLKRASSKRSRGWPWSDATQLACGIVVVVATMALCIVLDRRFDLFGQSGAPTTVTAPVSQTIETAAARPPSGPTPTAPASPLPSVYGVYALDDGRLYELEALPGRVPDQKVFMSTPVKTQSRTVLPDGQVAFVVYRRDLAGNAPDRVAVRVIAKVTRAMTFSTAGQASTASLEDEWTIRSNAYELRVAPVPEHAEMLMVRPEDSDFALPPGRYGLVLKGQAYDFTIAGEITDVAQCLERIEAANGAFYSECRHP